MHTTILATFFEISRTVVSMCSAGILLFLVALWAAKTDIARGGGLDKIVALSNLCFAVPLAVFVAEHLSAARFIMLDPANQTNGSQTKSSVTPSPSFLFISSR
jgi:hypothetical protein